MTKWQVILDVSKSPQATVEVDADFMEERGVTRSTDTGRPVYVFLRHVDGAVDKTETVALFPVANVIAVIRVG